MNKFISAVIDRLENGQTVLRTEDGQTLTIATAIAPEAKTGETVRIKIERDTDASAEKETLAKNMLNELLRKD